MKSDKLQMPDIYLDMRTLMDIYQRGGRITRSTRSTRAPASKLPEGKTREKHKSIQQYLGEPSLTRYLQNTNVKYEEAISNEYFAGKRLKRLSKQHLPENCLYYEKTLISQQLSYRLRSVKLNAKKSKANEYFIEEPARPTLPSRSLNSQDDAGVLTAVQSLLLHLLPFDEFHRIFEPILLDLKKSYKAIKIEELSRITEQRSENMIPEERELPSEPPSNQPPSTPPPPVQSPSLQPPAHLPNPLAQPSLNEAGEIRTQEVGRNAVQPDPEQIFEVINKEIAGLDRAIFKRLCLPGMEGILWPCVSLQPLVGERDELEVMIYRKLDQASKEEYRSSKEPKYDEKVLHLAFEEYLDSLALDHLEKPERERPNPHVQQRCVQKAEEILRKVEGARQSKVLVNLVGTHQSKILYNGFISLEEFEAEQVQELVMKTPLRGLVDELNEHIECLNRFKRLENVSNDGKHCLYRLCKYENDRNETELCIPLRIEQQSKEEKKALVRFLRDEHAILHEEQVLRWIELSKLSVNFTLPKHSELEKKFYYILGNNISIEEGINYIYADFYYRSCNFNEVLRICYPLTDLRRVRVKEQRCISCYYQVQNLPYYRCKFCLKFCHQECTAFRSRAQSESETMVPLDIYETENEEELWNCGECAPCVECQMAVKSSFIQCISCKNVYHPICGKLKGVAEEAFDEEKYTCESCLKCRMCSAKLKSQDYCCDGDNIFCVKCYKDYSNNEYCALCMKEAHGDWVQCDQRPCEKWIHISCDNYFKEKKIVEPIEKLNYSCPQCRSLEKRKIFRNVVEELKYFDEFQYFYEPDYEELIGYKEAIKHPICILQMREKALEGAYDRNSYELMRADLELLVRNAMTFNMPKDEAHYRAKLLLVVGTRYLDFFRELLGCSEEYLVNHNLEEVYQARKKQFYSDLYEHYLEYLLNFRQERGVVEVRKIGYTPYEQEFFSSKIIISRIFSNAEFTFRVKQKPHKIENLFSIPRLAVSSWWPVRQRTCFYHPEQQNPIIFECGTCWETYCCTRTCFNHRICTSCGQKGCGCDNFECQCPPLKQKEKKLFEAKINSTLSQSKLQKRQYTEYYRYCLKCVADNLKTNWCYLCHTFCYFAYERCNDCSRVYHILCERKNRWEEMAPFFESRAAYRSSYSCLRLPRICYSCSYSPKNARQTKEQLAQQVRGTASKINAIGKYLPIFNYIYELNGIRLAPHEVSSLLFHNYQEFSQREQYFQEFLMNFSVVIESMGNNRIAREEFREYFMNEITRKLAGQVQHEKYISIVETREIKELKQSKKFFKIYSKWFSSFYHPAHFANAYEVKYHLEHLTSKVNHHSGLNIGFAQIYTLMITDHHHFTNFREENHLNSKNFERIKIESITSYVSPKSKKNIYYTNRLEKYKLHLSFLTHYYAYKAARAARLAPPPTAPTTTSTTPGRPFDFEAVTRDYEKYFRFHSDNENLTDCIYKEEGSKTLLSDVYHAENFNPFHENTTLVKYNKLSVYREHETIYTNNKSEMLYKYLSSFALKIFEENKVVLKKGNTAILRESKRCWRVLKRIRGASVEVKLEKRDEQWVLVVGESTGVVRSIEDIVRRLREVCPFVSCFEDIVEFMGFGMTENTFYEPNHFTHLLQTQPLDSLNRKDRKREVLKVYEKHNWQRQGNFTLETESETSPQKFEYNVTKKELFYLKKRGHEGEEQLVEPKVVPFITFEDIKKDLDDFAPAAKQKDHLVMREPTYDVYIAPSKIDRLGLFIRNLTKKGTVVVEYIGEVISEAMADVREQKFHLGCYMFGLGKNNTRLEIIDATFVGNMARYLNHSCDPNCKAKIELHNGHPRILIYTIKDVKENEELTYDYQFKIDANDRLACKCKSKNCQGRLT